jgi:hypothetical protein
VLSLRCNRDDQVKEWTGHVTPIRAEEFVWGFCEKARKKRDHCEDLHVGRSIVLRRILEKRLGAVWTKLISLAYCTSPG